MSTRINHSNCRWRHVFNPLRAKIGVLLLFVFLFSPHLELNAQGWSSKGSFFANQHDYKILKKTMTRRHNLASYSCDKNGNVVAIQVERGQPGWDDRFDFRPLLDLQHLTSISCEVNFKREYLGTLAHKHPGLEFLHIPENGLTPEDFKLLGSFSKLKGLSFAIYNKDETYVLPQLPRTLESLAIHGVGTAKFDISKVTESIAQLKQLSRLQLPTSWNGEALLNLKPLDRLSSLSFGQVNVEEFDWSWALKLMVDHQGLTVSEATERLGLTAASSGLRMAVYETMMPYLSEIENVESLWIHTRSFAGNGVGQIVIPEGVKSISIIGPTTVDLVGAIAERKTVKKITFKDCLTIENLSVLKNMDWLTKLDVSDNQLKKDHVAMIQKVAGLTELDMSDTMLDDSYLVSITGWKNLSDLDVRGTEISEKGIFRLANALKMSIRNLNSESMILNLDKNEQAKLSITNVNESTSEFCQFLSDFCKSRQIKTIERLTINDCDLSDEDIATLSKLPIHWLQIRRCSQITEASIHTLEQCKQLKSLSISQCDAIAKDSVKSLRKTLRSRLKSK